MSAATPPSSTASSPEPIFRLTVKQYHELIRAGIPNAGDAVEFLEGVLLQKMTRNPPHATSVRRARRAIEPLLQPGQYYDSEQAITLDDGEPEPDGAVVLGSVDDYVDHHPTASDVLLVIEVADLTLLRDRTVKLRSYARARVPIYWIINLIDRQIEVFTDPDPSAIPEPTYRQRLIHSGVGVLQVPGVGATVSAADLLPPG